MVPVTIWHVAPDQCYLYFQTITCFIMVRQRYPLTIIGVPALFLNKNVLRIAPANKLYQTVHFSECNAVESCTFPFKHTTKLLNIIQTLYCSTTVPNKNCINVKTQKTNASLLWKSNEKRV